MRPNPADKPYFDTLAGLRGVAAGMVMGLPQHGLRAVAELGLAAAVLALYAVRRHWWHRLRFFVTARA